MAVGPQTVPGGTKRALVGYASTDETPPETRLIVETLGPSPVEILLDQRIEARRDTWHDVAFDVPSDAHTLRIGVTPPQAIRSVSISRPAWLGDASARNLILISIDTLRADYLNTYGYDRHATSPAIDLLADRGTLFEAVIAPSPWTVPSHMALFTGLDPNILGMDEFANFTPRLDRGFTTLAELFQQAGYLTVAFTGTMTMTSTNGFSDGFYLYHEHRVRKRIHRDLESNLEATDRWLRKHPEKPFFLLFHTFEAHDPYFHDEFVEPGMGAVEKQKAKYASGIAYVDERIGTFLETLEERGLLENTLIVITSDHGEGFEDDHFAFHGRTLFEDVLRVPLIFVGPDIPKGLRIPFQVPLQDVFATLIEYFGLELPPSIQSRSLLSLVRGEENAPRETYLCCMAHHFQREGWRDQRYKFVRSWRKQGLSEALFDLETDPGERINRVSELPEIAERLRQATTERTVANKLRAESNEPSAPVDENYLEQLEALGYIQ
ncbi:sulfatase-like hydrolase/transferase [Myxococcota bacterium]|nr:sulfatase-like hydrolase/transferase [Myxococcota bacterium]